MYHTNSTTRAFAITLIRGHGALPIHEQIVNGVRHAISSGRLKAGDRLPPVRELARQLEVAMNTVARAYRELDSEGLTDNHAGRGTFVRQLMVPQPHHWTNEATAGQILRPAITALSAMGLTRVEISAAVEKLLSETPLKLGVIGSSVRGARKWAQSLRDNLKGLWIEAIPLSIDELTDDHEAAAKHLEGVTFVFTLLASYHVAREVLEGSNKQVVPLITQLSHGSQQDLLALPRDTTIGLVCEDLYVNSILELVGAYAPSVVVDRVRIDDFDGIARVIDTSEVVLHSFAAGEIVEQFPAGKGRLLPLVYTLSEENLGYIRALVSPHAPPRNAISATGVPDSDPS